MHIHLVSHVGTVLFMGTASVGALSLKHGKGGNDVEFHDHRET